MDPSKTPRTDKACLVSSASPASPGTDRACPVSPADHLSKIEEYAALFLLPEEIAILVNINFKDFTRELKNKTSPIYLAYMRGKIKTKLELRKNTLLMARNGSPQAELMASKFMREQSLSETEM